MEDGFVSRVKGWIAHPFTSDMSILNWALFVGLVLIAAFFWTRVMSHIVEGA